MNLTNKNIAIVSAYEAPYGGNFIKMLIALGNGLKRKGGKPYFIFPKQIEKDWLIELKELFTVEFTCKPYGKSTLELLHLFKIWHIDLVHTHFEAYDIPVAKAIKKGNLHTKMIWHLHDYMSLDKTGLSFPHLRKIFSNQKFWNHYGRWGKDAYYIGVSAEVTNFATHYRKHLFSYPTTREKKDLENASFPQAEVVINGIDISRLQGKENYHFPCHKTTFLSFGGESKSKGIPCILDAADSLEKQGFKFELHITQGYTTNTLIASKYPKGVPSWLKLIEQTDNIPQLFNECHCYISASLKETMSMAIAEASIYGLPIIQSDIPGTWWNSHNPSTFLFHVNDAKGLARQMKNIINADKDELTKKTKFSSKKNQELLSMKHWCKKILEIYESI